MQGGGGWAPTAQYDRIGEPLGGEAIGRLQSTRIVALRKHDALALLTLLALPVGGLFGYSLSAAIVGMIDSEVYRFPLYVSRQAVALSFLGIIAATVFSGLVVRRKLDHLDLVAVLKIRE